VTIFTRSLTREFSAVGGAVVGVLVAITVVQQLVFYLRRAAIGTVEPEAVIALMGFALLGYLPVLLAVTLFIAVLLTLSRSYRDSEMPVWFSSGLSLAAWVGPVLRFAGPIVALTALLSLFLTPWSLSQSSEYRRILKGKDDVQRLSPGSFMESRGADRVFFVDKTSNDSEVVNNVFVQYTQQGRSGVVVAEKGFQQIDPNGDKFLVLLNGRRYEGTPGALDFRIIDFERQKIRVEATQVKADDPKAREMSTLELLQKPDAEKLAELHWRFALPIAALLLALMAIPLSFVNPRSGTSWNLVLAALVFSLYYQLLIVFQTWTQQGRLSPWIGLWPVHLGMMTTLLVLFSRQLYSFKWLAFARR
jgi:lipopolysaccharide export system permease protein